MVGAWGDTGGFGLATSSAAEPGEAQMEILVKLCPESEGGHAPTCFSRPPFQWGPPPSRVPRRLAKFSGILPEYTVCPQSSSKVQPQTQARSARAGPQGQPQRPQAQTLLLCWEGPSSDCGGPVIRFIVMTAWVYRVPLSETPSVLMPILLRFRAEAREG